MADLSIFFNLECCTKNRLKHVCFVCAVFKILLSSRRFFEKLAKNMDNPSVPIYSASAEVVGMALKYMSEKETSETDKDWREKYVGLISKMLLNTQMKMPNVFITCVHKMRQHYPQVVDK